VAEVSGQLMDIMMYTDIDFEYHSQLSTTVNLTVDLPIILHMLGEEISTAGPIHIYQGTVKISCITWDSGPFRNCQS